MVVKLPKEERALYSELPKCYLKKKYKKGIRVADKILKNAESPMYSKTLAWKGLFFGLLGKPESGIKTVQKGLNKDNNSSLCWHVYGKLQTIRGEYKCAVECYSTALMIAPHSPGVTKDLAFAQAHLGDLVGYKQTSGEMLRSTPRSKESWIMYVTASQAAGDSASALSVLSSLLESSHSKLMDMSPWEQSELLLYQNDLLREVGETGKALTHLLENWHKICDVIVAEESLVELYLETGQHQEAVVVAQSLLKKNPNNKKYFDNLFYALRLSSDAAKADALEQILKDFTDEPLPMLLFLQYGSGKKFVHHLTSYVKTELTKGSTNLFHSLKSLLSNDVKRGYIKSLLKRHNAVVSKNVTNCPGLRKSENELFSNILCMAKIYDFEGDHDQALETVKKAIFLSPLAPEGYVARAKFLKHVLNPTEACRAMEKAQRLDQSDRWLEVKLIKYLLRADLIQQAETLHADIHKYDEESETPEELWYLYEKAAAYKRLGKIEEALAMCQLMESTIVSIKTLLFDMHLVCLQKSSVRIYKEFIKEIDNLRRNKFYLKTADLAVTIAIQQQDAKLAQYKKQRKIKMKLSAARNAIPPRGPTRGKNQASKDQGADGESSDSDIEPPKNDPDYFQDHLLSVRHYLRNLQTYLPNRIETQMESFEVYRRFRRPLLMMQSLLKARKIDQDHQSLLWPTVYLYKSLMRWSAKEMLPQKKLAVLMEMGRKGLWRNKTMEQIINVFLRSHGKDLLYFLEGAKALYKMHPSKRDDALKLASYMGNGAIHRDVPTCRKVLDEMLKGSFGPCNAEAEEYRRKCAELFKNTTAFDIDAVKKMRAQDLVRTFENREPLLPDLHPIKDRV